MTIRRIATAGSVLLVLALGLEPATVTSAQQSLAVRDDPLTLFAELMPVLSHERCANCHGATDPYRGFYHPGAVPQTSDCTTCHSATPKWTTAPPVMAFHGKSTRQLCDHFAAFDPLNSQFLDIHLQTDELINLAFIGRRGNAVSPQFTQPPPMSKTEFIRIFRTWVRDGGAACTGWEGTITEEQTIGGHITLPASGGDVTHWQEGSRTLTITISEGQATVTSQVNGFENNRLVMTSDACVMTSFSQKVYRIVGQNGAGPPPPPVSAPPGTPWARPPAVPVTGKGAVRIGLDAAGNYRIQATPPQETIETTSYESASNTCGAPAPPSTQNSDRITWDPFVIEISGTLPDPRNRRQLKGQSDVQMTTAETDRDMGIEMYGAASEVEGRPIPFKVKRTWDLRRVP